MKINVENTLVEFTPQSEDETKELNDLWGLIVHCARSNLKLVPVGEYLPGKTETARFNIED